MRAVERVIDGFVAQHLATTLKPSATARCAFQRPEGRHKSILVKPQEQWGDVAQALGRAIERGDQVYWICPLVEETEVSTLTAAEEQLSVDPLADNVQSGPPPAGDQSAEQTQGSGSGAEAGPGQEEQQGEPHADVMSPAAAVAEAGSGGVASDTQPKLARGERGRAATRLGSPSSRSRQVRCDRDRDRTCKRGSGGSGE